MTRSRIVALVLLTAVCATGSACDTEEARRKRQEAEMELLFGKSPTGGKIVRQEISLDAGDAQVSEIRIQMSKSAAENVRFETNGARASLVAQLVGDDPAGLDGIKEDSTATLTGNLWSVKIASGAICGLSTRNGEIVSARGTCVESVVVTIPAIAGARAVINGIPASPGAAWTVEELRAGVKSESFGEGKIRVVEKFLESPGQEGRCLSMAEAVDLIQGISFDHDRVAVARLLSGRVKDPENVSTAEKAFHFSGEKARGVELLSK